MKLTAKLKAAATQQAVLQRTAKLAADTETHGSWTKSSTDLQALTPMDFTELAAAGFAMRVPASRRSYLSKQCKARGINYRSLAIEGTKDCWIFTIK